MLIRQYIQGIIGLMLMLAALPVSAQQTSGLLTEHNLSLIANPAEGGLVSGAGNYPANTGVAVTATPEEGFIFLHWSDEVGELVSTQASFTFTMPDHDVELTAHFACTPDWSFEENYQFTMQFVAKIAFDDVISLNAGDMAAAFVGDECRGFAHPMPEHDGLVFLSVGSNELSGEMIELKLWNSSICDSCSVSQLFEFENMATIGNLTNPLILQCSNEISLEIDFNAGYTWFSLNVEQYYMQADTIFNELSPCYNDRIIGQHSFAVYDGERWVGNLTALSPVKMYRMRLCEAQSIEIFSNQAPNTSISLPSGSTWLGYRPDQCMSPNEALQNISPEPAYNDRILGQHAFALYNGSQWIGSLTQLCPGKGYIIKLTSPSELTFPSSMTRQGNNDMVDRQPSADELLTPPGNHQHSMMLVGKLYSQDPKLKFHPEDRIYAIIDGEIRGVAAPMPAYSDLLFMSIGENTLEDKDITFKAWLSETQSFYNIQESTHFEDMAERGTLEKPFSLSVLSTHTHSDSDIGFVGQAYPNPAIDKTFIDIDVREKARLQIHIFDHLGQMVRSDNQWLEANSNFSLPVQTSALNPGLYLIRIRLYSENKMQQASRPLLVQ